MKTSHLLPEECKAEIRERIAERERWLAVPPLQGRVAEAVILREIVMLKWVLEEEKPEGVLEHEHGKGCGCDPEWIDYDNAMIAAEKKREEEK